MDYRLDEIPLISRSCSYQVDKIKSRVVCFSLGQIKILNCAPDVLEEVLSLVKRGTTFGEIEGKFINRYPISDVRFFLQTILQEGIIEKSQSTTMPKLIPHILVIGEGLIAESLENCSYVAVNSFLSEEYLCDFDIGIFAPSICTYSDMIGLNEKLYKLQKPFIPFYYNGAKVIIGPLVVPNKSACLECGVSHKLKNMNLRISYDNKIVLDDLKNLNYSFDISQNICVLKLTYVADILQNDLIGYFNGAPSVFLDVQYSFKSDFSSFENFDKEECLPTTCCDFCKAINNNYVQINSTDELKKHFESNLTRLTEQGVKYQIGGIRSKTESETNDLLNNELNRLGTKIKIERAIGNPFNDSDIIPCYNAFLEQTNYGKLPYLLRKDESSGKGITKSQSYFSAAFELFEHIGRQYTGDIPIISARYRDIKGFAIDMPRLASTIMNKNTAFDKFDEDIQTDWVVATSLTDESKKLVPAFLVFMFDVELKGTLFSPSSSGIAAGATLEDAILHGLFEAVEDDAWLIGQSNPYILPLIDYSSIANAHLKEVILKIKRLGYDVITRDYTNDLTIPVFRTWLVNRNNYSKYAYSGFGCHASPEIALERSITEAVQTNDIADFGGNIEPFLIDKTVLSKSLVSLYNQHFLVNKDILGETDKISQISKPIFDLNSSYEVIKKASKLIKEKINGDVYYVTLTKPGMKINVARVILTGDAQILNYPIISASKRMFEFGIRCGYSDRKTTYEELFLGDYQS